LPDLHAAFQRPGADAREEGLFAFLDQVDRLPHIQAIKRRMTDLLGLRAGQRILDAGCGMGHEALRLAGRVAPGGTVLGIDTNHVLAGEAGQRTAGLDGAVRCAVGDVQHLALADAVMDGARAERVLMYVPDHQRAISELVRVVRPGGTVVAFELDYGATLVDLPDQPAAQRVLGILARTVAHRWMGRSLARLFHRAGLRDIVTDACPVALPPHIHRQLVGPALSAAVADGSLDAQTYRQWQESAQDSERNGYHSDTFIGVVAAGHKAGRQAGSAPPGPIS
jgi:ubiquinone/menaquinone biosynthesis C-methylase UbiE